MATSEFRGAACLIAGLSGGGEVDNGVIVTLGHIGETLLAAADTWHVRRLSAIDSIGRAPSRANLKQQIDELCNDALDARILIVAGQIVAGSNGPALVTGGLYADYPDEATLPLVWMRDRLGRASPTATVIVVSVAAIDAAVQPGDGATASLAAVVLEALRSDRRDELVVAAPATCDHAVIAAVLDGLAGEASDSRTGTVTLRSLCDQLSRVSGAVMQRSELATTVARVAPFGGRWGAFASRHQGATSSLRCDPDDLLGTVLPGYVRLDARIAEGSFGIVYRARQIAMDRDVAVKVLHADVDPESSDVRLFVDEIRAVGKIKHNSVVEIHHADLTRDGRLFFVMDFLDGRDLQHVIEDEAPMAPARALALMAHLIAGLGAAHAAGLVHADVKPGNAIVVGQPPAERLVLIDFGLARLRQPGATAASVGGTPAYMAPEQLTDHRVDARSDLFAAALVLVAMLTGRTRRDARELVPPLDDITDAALRSVLARALAVDPAARFQDAADLERALAGGASAVSVLPIARPPFRHLAPITEDDPGGVPGREHDLALLIEQVLYRRAVVYTAPSGTGKTSLLRAGLLPRLVQLGQRARYLACRPGCRSEVVAALDGILGASGDQRVGRGAVIVLDQLETLFSDLGGNKSPDPADTADGTPASDDRALIGLVLDAAARVGEDHLAVVLSVREDFLARLLATETRLQQGIPVVRLRPLNRAGARAAITAPLAAQRLAIEPYLLDALLDDLAAAGAAIGPGLGWDGPAIYPPHLQLACSVLYDALPSDARVMTFAAYRKLGGFDAIVGEYLERVLESELDADAVQVARDLFVTLISAASTRVIRSEAELIDLDAGRHGSHAIRAVLDVLAKRGLIARTRIDGDEFGWELIHDSLVPRVAAWIDSRDLARRRAIEILRYHLRRSEPASPSLLGWKELRELRGRDDAIIELTASWQHREAAWTPARLVARSRQVLRRRLAVAGLVAVVALGVTVAALLRLRAEQVRRDRDLGRFTLELRALDWDPVANEERAVAISELPQLSWELHQPDPADFDRPSLSLPPLVVVRHGREPIAEGARVREDVEARGGRTWLVIRGRDRTSDCAPSIIPVYNLPGYASRNAPPPVLRIAVPTCHASRVGMVKIPAGPFVRGGPGTPPSSTWKGNPERIERKTIELRAFAIDRTEVTNAAFTVFASMAEATGIAKPPDIGTTELAAAGYPEFPVAAITWSEARAYCGFLGKQLPTSEQWEKTLRGGSTLPDGSDNDAPERNLPWGAKETTKETTLANVKATGRHRPAPVGQFAGDVSPYGVLDLAGNLQEWTVSIQKIGGMPQVGWRITRGANWDDADAKNLVDYMSIENPRLEATRSFAIGVRCVVDGD